MKVYRLKFITWMMAIGFIVAACGSFTQSDNDSNPQNARSAAEMRVALVVDGERRTFVYDRLISVEQFLGEAGIGLNPSDRIDPPRYTTISDGLTITIVRVREEEECYEDVLPFGRTELSRPDWEPGYCQMAELGVEGKVQICDRVVYEDNVQVSRNQQSRIVIQEPEDEIIFCGIVDDIEPIAVEGTLAYISGGQAYIIRNNTTNRRPLTIDGGLDGRAFDLSANGRQLLFTRQTTDPTDAPFSNELWVVLDTVEGSPIQLPLTNVLSAVWQPNTTYTVAYSTARPEGGTQGWNAYNDLFVARVNDQTGEIIATDEVVAENFVGLYAYWGTRFAWSPDGTQVAYAKADGIGLVDRESGAFGDYLVAFPHYNLAIQSNWVWQPTVKWSQDGEWIITTVHGAPYGSEIPVDSIVFNIGVFTPDGELVVDTLIQQAGIWSNPSYSPIRYDDEFFPVFSIAYLQARNPLNSYGTEYDLVLVDRDGSNPRVLFPGPDRAGIRPVNQRSVGSSQCFDGEYAWSPTGRQIAVIYQCNLWILDVQSGLAQQVTYDERVSFPVWMQ